MTIFKTWHGYHCSKANSTVPETFRQNAFLHGSTSGSYRATRSVALGIWNFAGNRQPQEFVEKEANVTGEVRFTVGSAAEFKGTMGRMGHCAANLLPGGKAIQPDATFNGCRLRLFNCHVSNAIFIDT